MTRVRTAARRWTMTGATATAIGRSSRKISAGNEVVVVVEPNVKALSPAVMTMVIQQKTIIFSKMMALPVIRYYYIMCTVWLLHVCLLHNNMYSMAIIHVQHAYCINAAII